MEVAPGPLARTFTAPQSSHSRINNSSSGSSLATQSQYYRSSDSTQGTSQSSIVLPSTHSQSIPSNGGLVEASNNVLNKVADKDASLFQICVTLRNRLRGVQGFEEQLLREEEDAGEDTDPVTLLWRTFRRGYPLMIIYNALQPEVPLEMVGGRMAESRREKDAAFKFLHACVHQLKFPTEECFIITDLYGDDTTGFVKVATVVNRVVDILVQKGFLTSIDDQNDDRARGPGKMTQRQHIVDELVRTERTYVQHLEVLQSFKKHVEQKGVIPGDAIHDIFLNLNALLDFQRRFLIRVEQTNAQPESDQNWGKLFTLYADAFKVYEPYIANQKKCEETAMREFDKLKEAGGPPELQQIVESPTHLTSFLLKPFTRLTKYPLLLKELLSKGELDEKRKADVSLGIQAASAVLERTNATLDLEERMQAVQDLKQSVEDWKGHRVDAFGQLLLYGIYTVLKGDASKDSDSREYNIYLFEKILLCCKEVNMNKQKGKIISKSQSANERRGKLPKLQLKGRIFMANVTECIFLAKPGGSYTCQIFWRADDAIEFFVIKYTTEEVMRKWEHQLNIQTQEARDDRRNNQESEFVYMRNQEMENPYLKEYADDDEYDSSYMHSGEDARGSSENSGFMSSRNGSSSSLRSRSTTAESGPPLQPVTSRGTTTRYIPGPTVLGAPSLTLRTQQLPATTGSPAERGANSYFSPGADSPISARTSTSSGMFPFPRQATPQQNGWHDDHTRYTAPAMGRNPLKDGQSGSQNYTDARGIRNPSNGNIHHPAAFAQTRLRSASSPDVHVPTRRIGPNGVPEVPPVPSHLAQNSVSVNRSQSNSPNGIVAGGSQRGTPQSPNSKRQMYTQTGQQPYPSQYQYGQDGAHVRNESTASSHTTATSYGPRYDDVSSPTQLKVKVKVPSEGSTMTLVVGVNISYQSLKDRIDAKLQRHTNLSLSAGNVKLKYYYDDELVSIQTDEDVQTAFETWREQDSDHIMAGQLGEIELYVHR